MTARRFIGGHDWYREGCDWLLPAQGQLSGFWVGNAYGEEDESIATSMALLFLSKGRRPILIAKLKQGVGDEWNRHRGDVANLTRYVESRWQMDLNWQMMDLQMATVDDLRQSPVLYINASAARCLRPAGLAAKLRAYLDRSGFIFAELNCGGKAFENGFRQLMGKVFPSPNIACGSPAEHPIWFAEENMNPKPAAAEGNSAAARAWFWPRCTRAMRSRPALALLPVGAGPRRPQLPFQPGRAGPDQGRAVHRHQCAGLRHQ